MTAETLAALLVRAPARTAWLPFTLPSFNDLEHARARVVRAPSGRGMWNGYNALKREHQQTCALYFNRLRPVHGPIVIAYRFVERDRRRDPGNILAGADKIICDALGPPRLETERSCGWPGASVIHCDGQHCLAAPPVSTIEIADRPSGAGIEVNIYEVRS